MAVVQSKVPVSGNLWKKSFCNENYCTWIVNTIEAVADLEIFEGGPKNQGGMGFLGEAGSPTPPAMKFGGAL